MDKSVNRASTDGAGASRRLAAWVVATPRAWTARGFVAAERAVYDSLLCAVGGAGDLKPVLDSLEGGSGRCPVPGRRGLRVAADAAALAWGTAIHVREMDDQTYSLGGHLMCVTLAALLCVRYGRDTPWEDIFDAVVVACEVESRINRCMTRKHMERGWVATTTYGLVGAACAIARIERFTEDQALAALSLACNKAFGNKNLFGTRAKAVNTGLAARDAVMLARMAGHGLLASADPLEGPYGFGALYRGEAVPDWSPLLEATEGSSPREPCVNTGMAFKRHPCCASAHRCVDALLELRTAHGFGASDVESVTAYVGPLNHLTLRYAEPSNASQAMFSMPYILACALRFGVLSPADFSSDAIGDPATRALLPRIAMRLLPAAQAAGFVETVPLAHRVEVVLRDGRGTVGRTVLHPRGAPGDPFTAEDWELKFHHCTGGGVLPAGRAEEIGDALKHFTTRGVDAAMDLLASFDAAHDPRGARFRR